MYFEHLDSLSTAGVVSDGFVTLAMSIYDFAEGGRRAGVGRLARDISMSGLAAHEEVILLSAVSVAECSIDYWTFEVPYGILRSTALVHPVVAADVVGGVCGGVTAWLSTRNTGHSDWADIAGGAAIGALGASTLGFLRLG